MNKILLILFLFTLNSCFGPRKSNHKHSFEFWEKCNGKQCGAWCKCGAKKLYHSGKIIKL